MKKRTSFIVTLVLTFLVSAFSQKTDAYAFSYTYTVSFYSGAQGTFSGAGAIQVRKGSGNSEAASINSSGDKITVSGLEYGDVISCDAQDGVSLNDNSKYYVKGIRLSGRDNKTVSYSAFEVNGDQDYVVAYGIPGELAEYTVNYVDAAGNKLADSMTYYGNVGDEPVIAYLYIDGYIPDNYNQTGTLVSDASKNVFNFVYSPASTTAGIQNTAGNANAAGGANNAAAGAGNTPAGGNANTPGGDGAGAGTTDGNGNAANAAGNDGVVVPDGGNEPQADGQLPDAQQNTTIDDQAVPQAANDDSDHEIKDQNVPLSALLMENGMVIPIGIGILAALALTAAIVLIVRSKSKAASAAGDETKADIESDDKN